MARKPANLDGQAVKDLTVLHITFAADRMLFTIHNATVRSYDGKLRVNVDTCTQPMDFDKMTDGYYTETTYTLNRKGQIFQSKPKSYSRSVLVALNID